MIVMMIVMLMIVKDDVDDYQDSDDDDDAKYWNLVALVCAPGKKLKLSKMMIITILVNTMLMIILFIHSTRCRANSLCSDAFLS